ncbi:DUF1616 domain-containing protein [Planosporangium mesophilum]|uniref:DUF1616 domain-containing protein n=1 Tax=Planosporangium mesophilum TaxID=689768 RepID=A0A8J3TDP8_9ACTN|nr:DUF1616 domain-containing protein [Planosporangium mesophilum]NJC84647.1 DUF1616 domain-containing protein [Planosporangium mesophilum]GII23957.1 hypothetical protein Pme01_35540 [Planosporangium mesophilum]
MRPAALHRDAVPVLAAVLAVVAAAAQWVPLPAVRVPTGLLLVFVLPGLALAAALFPGRVLSIVERLVLPPALSLAVLVLGGLGMFAAGIPLGRASWTALTTSVTVAAAVVARLRRDTAGTGSAAETAMFGRVLAVDREKMTVGAAVWRLAPLALAVLLIAGAGVLAMRSAGTGGEPFTGLSLVPSPAPDGQQQAPPQTPRTVQVAIRCEEGEATRYSLRIADPNGFERTFDVALEPGGRWSQTLEVPASGTVTADLFKNGGQAPYRSAHLAGVR